MPVYGNAGFYRYATTSFRRRGTRAACERSLKHLGTAGGQVLADIAQAHGATPRQVALAFLTRKPALFVIPKASDVPHVEDNAAGGAIKLLPEDVARIENAFPRRPKPRSLPMI